MKGYCCIYIYNSALHKYWHSNDKIVCCGVKKSVDMIKSYRLFYILYFITSRNILVSLLVNNKNPDLNITLHESLYFNVLFIC